MLQGLIAGCLFYGLGRAYRMWADRKTVNAWLGQGEYTSLYPTKHLDPGLD